MGPAPSGPHHHVLPSSRLTLDALNLSPDRKARAFFYVRDVVRTGWRATRASSRNSSSRLTATQPSVGA
jgi:hypothetical protein